MKVKVEIRRLVKKKDFRRGMKRFDVKKQFILWTQYRSLMDFRSDLLVEVFDVLVRILMFYLKSLQYVHCLPCYLHIIYIYDSKKNVLFCMKLVF